MQLQKALKNNFFNSVIITMLVLQIGVESQPNDKIDITCPKPTSPRNGTAEFENDINKPGDAVKYICDEGFTMIGSSTRHCNTDGRWSGERPTCEKLCPFPALTEGEGLKHKINPDIKDNLLDTAGNVVIKEIEFTCDNNFTMSGPQRIRCLGGGRWDHAPPKCIKEGSNFCSDLGTPDNGERNLPISNVHLPGSVMRYSCKNTFRMTGEPMSICTDGGTWTSPLPKCTAMTTETRCSTPQPPNNGDISIEVTATLFQNVNENPNMHVAGTKVHYKCNEWYELDGLSNRQCLPNGQWSGSGSTVCKPVCGKIPDDKIPFIINGTSSKMGSWPWQVGFTEFQEGLQRRIQCGGAILNEMWVITAAHCVSEEKTKTPKNADSLLLFFGKYYHEFNLDDNTVDYRRVQFVTIHHDYDPLTFDNDIALVMLKERVDMNDRIRPICLPRPDSQRTYQSGLKGVVMGWGAIDELGAQPDELQYVLLPLVEQKTCQEAYGSKITVTNNMFCAGFKEGGQNTCQGDSGGPMGFLEENGNDKRFFVEGLVSWGNKVEFGCASPGRYGGFVRVCNFVDWIHSVITPSKRLK